MGEKVEFKNESIVLEKLNFKERISLDKVFFIVDFRVFLRMV